MPERSAYCATKAAVEMMMRCLARELAPHAIRVNAVAPGFISTPMNEALRADPGFISGIEALTPAGRLGLPEEVAAAILFLVTPASNFVHGETLTVSGGYPSPV
jgi:NAD(P)-dependent dehydrogenase (short-subunit alcohol dehydrogenase family)